MLHDPLKVTNYPLHVTWAEKKLPSQQGKRSTNSMASTLSASHIANHERDKNAAKISWKLCDL